MKETPAVARLKAGLSEKTGVEVLGDGLRA